LPRRDNRPGLLLAGMAEHFRLAALLCDHEGLIQHSVGEVDRYLQFPVGANRLALGEVVLPGLRGEALTLLRRYQTTGRPQRSRRRRVGEHVVRLHLAPVSETGGQMMLVMFLPDTPLIEPEAASEAPARDEGHLEDELAATGNTHS
jgi:two-component system CheB/CheR fusion protein